MSRIGNRILTIPKDTIVKLENGTNPLESFNPVIGNIVNNSLTVTGVKGSLKKILPNIIKINIDNEKKTISTIRPDDNKKNKQLHGTINSLINGMLIGVSRGFMKELEINGVGYRAAVQGNILNLTLGYSHPIKFEIPQGISIVAPKPTVLQISGIDKQLVGEVAAKIRQFRKPEPYKGKGIKYKNEHIRRKEGKAAGKGK